MLARLLRGTDFFALSPFAWGVRAAVHAGRGDLGGFAHPRARRGAGGGGGDGGVRGRSSRGSRAASWTSGAASAAPRPSPARMRFAGPIGARAREGPADVVARSRAEGDALRGAARPAALRHLRPAGREPAAAAARSSTSRCSSACPPSAATPSASSGAGSRCSWPSRWSAGASSSGRTSSALVFRLPGLAHAAGGRVRPPRRPPAAGRAHHHRLRPRPRRRGGQLLVDPVPDPARGSAARPAPRRAAAAWARCSCRSRSSASR